MNTVNPYAPPRSSVTDVASGNDEPDLAGQGIRLGAYVLDYVIWFALFYVPFFVSLFLIGASNGDNWVLAVVLVLACWTAWLWMTCLFLARNGQTIAKKMLGIKVVRTDGSPASLGRLFWLRHVLSLVLSTTFVYFFVDVCFIFSEDRQCLHDKIADTIVVVA